MNKKHKVETRKFHIELKHRPPDDATGEREELIETVEMRIPKLADTAWEERWAVLSAWNMLSSKTAQEKNINQIFLFTADFGRLITRLEVNPFQDEKPRVLKPPSQSAHSQWCKLVEKRFHQLYGISMGEWSGKNKKGF